MPAWCSPLSRRGIPRGLVTVIAIVALISSALVYTWARASYGATLPPSIRLVGSASHLTATRWGPGAVSIDFGAYVAAVNGPLEIRSARQDGSWLAQQVIRDTDGSVRKLVTLPEGSVTDIGQGLAGFFDVTITDSGGATVAQNSLNFCPVSGFGAGRIDDSGPDLPKYPEWCGGSLLTEKMVWGIDRGWTGSATSFSDGASYDLPDGTYQVTLQIARRYAKFFKVDPKYRTAAVTITVITEPSGPPPCDVSPCPPRPGAASSAGSVGPGRSRSPFDDSEAAFPHGANPRAPEVSAGASGTPDLVALAPFNLFLNTAEGGEQLEFAANVWNRGPGPMVVEGYRRPGRDVLDAYQYFYDRGARVGKRLVGELEYDSRDGHQHWHFTDFAQYRILDESGTNALRSGKEAFCLAPTDPIDLTVRGAVFRPGEVGLGTACGWSASIWIREVLPVGWGDTYYQGLPGQSFDISGLPNGTYFLEVKANPDGRLQESSTSNNTALTRFVIKGSPGARYAEVV